jgi:hypothetical protein
MHSVPEAQRSLPFLAAVLFLEGEVQCARTNTDLLRSIVRRLPRPENLADSSFEKLMCATSLRCRTRTRTNSNPHGTKANAAGNI